MVVIIAKIAAILFTVFLFVSFALWGTLGIANYSASFVAFLFVSASSFIGYKRMVLASKELHEEKDGKEDDDEDEQKQSKISLLTKTYKGWLFPLRLVSYVLFVSVFLYFANNNILNVYAFLVGIAILPISALIFMLFFRREF